MDLVTKFHPEMMYYTTWLWIHSSIGKVQKGKFKKASVTLCDTCQATIGNRENFLQMNLSSDLLLQRVKSF